MISAPVPNGCLFFSEYICVSRMTSGLCWCAFVCLSLYYTVISALNCACICPYIFEYVPARRLKRVSFCLCAFGVCTESGLRFCPCIFLTFRVARPWASYCAYTYSVILLYVYASKLDHLSVRDLRIFHTRNLNFGALLSVPIFVMTILQLCLFSSMGMSSVCTRKACISFHSIRVANESAPLCLLNIHLCACVHTSRVSERCLLLKDQHCFCPCEDSFACKKLRCWKFVEESQRAGFCQCNDFCSPHVCWFFVYYMSVVCHSQ